MVVDTAAYTSHTCEGTSMNVLTKVNEHEIYHLINTIYHNQKTLSSMVINTKPPTCRADDVIIDIILELLHPWRRSVSDAGSKEDVIALVRHFGLGLTADRLIYLDRLADDDPEEEYIELESMRHFANFVLNRYLPVPKIGISPGGLIQAAWWAPDGIMSMDFLPSGKVRFVAFLQDSAWDVSGVLPLNLVMAKIEPFKRVLCQ